MENSNLKMLSHLKRYSGHLALQQVGYEKCQPSHFYGPAVRDFYLLHYIHNGNGVFKYNNEEISLSNGDIFLIYPEEVTYYQADAHEPWEYYWFGIEGAEAKQLLESVGFSKENRHIHYFLTNEYKIETVVSELINNKEMHESNRLFEVAKLYEIMAWLRKSYEQTNKSYITQQMTNTDYYLYLAKDYMNKNFMLSIQISDVASYVGIDRTQLFRLFKAEVGISPKEYLMDVRMAKAEDLLQSTRLTIKEITYSIGYRDPYLFSKMFKVKHGVSPSEYRNSD